MSNRSSPRLAGPPGWHRRIGAALSLCLLAGLAAAAPAAPRIEAFGPQTWQRDFAAPAAPAVVVFSTTDCAHCPRVIEQLADTLRQRSVRASLVAVVMDEFDASGLAEHPHYRRADRVLVFDGQPARLRHTVDPAWRGVTPYVVFLAPGKAPVFVAGPPGVERIDAWAGRTAVSAGASMEKSR